MSVRFLLGDTRDCLRQLPERSIQCVATSPPYYGLRDYGVEPSTWADGWVGCLGLEPTPEQYVEHVCEVFDAVARVLRKDGTLWLNLGDSYNGSNRGGFSSASVAAASVEAARRAGNTLGQRYSGVYVKPTIANECKPKDMIGIPWLTAFALRKRGWYLRAAAPWVKRNCMPESVTDRPVTATEMVFLFGHPESGGRYFYDSKGVLQPLSERVQQENPNRNRKAGSAFVDGIPGKRKQFGGSHAAPQGGGRNFRNTDPFFASLQHVITGGEAMLFDDAGDPLAFVVNPKPFRGAHFATWPPELVEPMIKASTSERGGCATCGAPWHRVVERRIPQETGASTGGDPARQDGGGRERDLSGRGGNVLPVRTCGTDRWEASCSCAVDPRPQTVLDPFSGSGTTALVAHALGRNAIYIDVKPEYLTMAQARFGTTLPPMAAVPSLDPAPFSGPTVEDFLAKLRRT